MTKKTYSIYDVAERAGVSISTVSRYVNGHSTVSQRARNAIQDAMDMLGYRPRPVEKRPGARPKEVKKKRLFELALLAPELAAQPHNSYFARAYRSLKQRAHLEGWCLVVPSPEHTNAGPHASDGPDAVILLHLLQEVPDENTLTLLERIKAPAAVMIAPGIIPKMDCVSWNRNRAGHHAALHLKTKSGPVVVLAEHGDPCARSFCQALTAKGLSPKIIDWNLPSSLKKTDPSEIKRALHQFAVDLAAFPGPPTVVFCTVEGLLNELGSVLVQHGPETQKDLTLMGINSFSDPLAVHLRTYSIEIPVEQMCNRAVDLIQHRILHAYIPQTLVLLDPEIVFAEET